MRQRRIVGAVSAKPLSDGKNGSWLIWLLYAVIAITQILTLLQNFLPSMHVAELLFREVDDLAFQSSMNKMQRAFVRGDWSNFFLMNDYAYGWAFWLLVSAFSFPGFVIRELFSIDWILVVSPRLFSWIAGIFSLVFVRLALREFGASKITVAFGLTFMSLLPSFGYYQMRFGTVALLTLASAFALFQFLRVMHAKESPIFLGLTVGFAAGIKITGLLIYPLLAASALFLLLKANGRVQVISAAYKAGVAHVVFLFSWIISTNPVLLLSPLFSSEAKTILSRIIHQVSGGLDSGQRLWTLDSISSSLTGSTWTSFALLIALAGFFLRALYNFDNARTSAIVVSSTAMFGLCTLLIIIGESIYAGLYLAPLAPLWALGLTGFQRWQMSVVPQGLAICLLVVGQVVTGISLFKQDDRGSLPWNILSYAKTYNWILSIRPESMHLVDISGLSNPSAKISAVMDHSVPLAANQLSHAACIQITFGNLERDSTNCGSEPPDVLLLDSKILDDCLAGHTSDCLTSPDVATRVLLTEEGNFRGSHYRESYRSVDQRWAVWTIDDLTQ